MFTRAKENWNATLLQPPNWSNHWLAETKRPVREISLTEEAALDEVESIDFAELRELATIMGLRRREVLLTWPQVDFDLRVIRIVGKGGVPAILPITQRAYQILWKLRGNHPVWVFTFVAQRTRPDQD